MFAQELLDKFSDFAQWLYEVSGITANDERDFGMHSSAHQDFTTIRNNYHRLINEQDQNEDRLFKLHQSLIESFDSEDSPLTKASAKIFQKKLKDLFNQGWRFKLVNEDRPTALETSILKCYIDRAQSRKEYWHIHIMSMGIIVGMLLAAWFIQKNAQEQNPIQIYNQNSFTSWVLAYVGLLLMYALEIATPGHFFDEKIPRPFDRHNLNLNSEPFFQGLFMMTLLFLAINQFAVGKNDLQRSIAVSHLVLGPVAAISIGRFVDTVIAGSYQGYKYCTESTTARPLLAMALVSPNEHALEEGNGNGNWSRLH